MDALAYASATEVAARIRGGELSPVEALSAGTRTALQASTLIIGGIYELVTGGVSVRSLGGPVAIGQLTGRFARRGWQSLMGWIALFSINLAILNLLPIPVLDGGHILFLAIEATRGRPLSARQELRGVLAEELGEGGGARREVGGGQPSWAGVLGHLRSLRWGEPDTATLLRAVRVKRRCRSAPS